MTLTILGVAPPPRNALTFDAHDPFLPALPVRLPKSAAFPRDDIEINSTVSILLLPLYPPTINPRAPPSRVGESVANSYHRSCAKNSSL